MDDKKRFLIVRLGAIGDLIHALPLASALKEFFPNSRVDWVVGDKFSKILENNPLLDNLYIANLSKWKKGWLLPSNIKEICDFNKVLQKNNYDYSFDAHGMFKSAVIQAFCGAKKRVGYKDYREFAAFASNVLVEPKSKRPHRNYHIIRRQLDMLTGCGLIAPEKLNEWEINAKPGNRDEKTIKKVDEMLLSLDKTKKIVIFAPATTWINKHWDKKNWAELYQKLKNKVNVVFSGTKGDLELIYNICNNDPYAQILAGKTNLDEYIELLSRADIVISPDSSASHIAWVLNKAVITIFCATSKHTFAPLGKNCFAFPKDEPKCIPCHKRKCLKKTMQCTFETDADEVYLKVLEILKLN